MGNGPDPSMEDGTATMEMSSSSNMNRNNSNTNNMNVMPPTPQSPQSQQQQVSILTGGGFHEMKIPQPQQPQKVHKKPIAVEHEQAPLQKPQLSPSTAQPPQYASFPSPQPQPQSQQIQQSQQQQQSYISQPPSASNTAPQHNFSNNSNNRGNLMHQNISSNNTAHHTATAGENQI